MCFVYFEWPFYIGFTVQGKRDKEADVVLSGLQYIYELRKEPLYWRALMCLLYPQKRGGT